MNIFAKVIILLNNLKYGSVIQKGKDNIDECIKEFIISNEENRFEKVEEIVFHDNNYQAVGGIIVDNKLYMTPANGRDLLVLSLDKMQFTHIGNLKGGTLRYSGIGKYKGMLYCFPRSANSIVRINPENDFVDEIELYTKYKKEHHYSGVITRDGLLYMPPRNENHILVVNLNTFETSKIKIGNMTYRYSGIVQHPNGYIYMIPEYNQKVIKLDPITHRFQFIGKFLKESRVLGPTISYDGDIYGFLGFRGGILKIDVKKERVEILCSDTNTGSLGTELAANGKLYSVPSYSNDIFEYDTKKQEIKKVGEISRETRKAACAGAAISEDGSIFCVPCHEIGRAHV